MGLTLNGKVLAILLVLFVLCGILLTPLSGIETRPPGDIKPVGLMTLSIFLFGLALDVASIPLMFRRARLGSTLAIVGSALFFPAFLADRAGQLSSLSAPVAIFYIEWVTAVVSILAIISALRVRGEKAPNPAKT